MADTCFVPDDAPDTDPLVYFPHVGFDGREVDVLAEMMRVTKLSAPPNVIRAALYHYAVWLGIENLHHDDFQLRRTAPSV